MHFNKIIKDKFSELLESFNFKISEDTKNSVTFKSDFVTIKFNYSPFEFAYNYFINLNSTTTAYENHFVEGYLDIKDENVFRLKTQEEKIELWATRKHNYFFIFRDTLLKGDKNFFAGLDSHFKKKLAMNTTKK